MQTKTKWIIGIVVIIIVAVGVYFADISLQKGALISPTFIQNTPSAIDMAVIAISTNQETLRTGDQVIISATVKAKTQSLVSTTSLMIDTNRQTDVQTGALNTSTATATWKWTAVEGAHTLVACADAGSTNLETDETNNCMSITISVLPPLPDLVIDDISLNAANGWLGITVIARNQGGPILDISSNGGAQRSNLRTEFKIAGETITTNYAFDRYNIFDYFSPRHITQALSSFTYLPRVTLPHSLLVTATVDTDGSIHESNESNNVLTKTLEVPAWYFTTVP